ncbi:MAG: response regulator [Methylococcaceae bacterium]
MSQNDTTMRLLSYHELLLTLQGLCKGKQTGVMLISSEAAGTAQLTLDQGAIFDISCGGVSGEAALLLLKKITQAKATFFKRTPGTAEQQIKLSTAEILQTLADKTGQAVAAKHIEPSVANEAGGLITQMMIIEMHLAIITGPVARLIYLDYRDEIQHANSLEDLSMVIEKMAHQVLIGEQQKIFKQNIREFTYRCALKRGSQNILDILKSNGRELTINPLTLALCIKKQAAHGEMGVTLLNKLATQVEYAGNLAGLVELFDLLRFLEKTTKTGFLSIELKGQKAGFYFEQGKLINAIEENKRGRAIAMNILQWQPDTMRFNSLTQIDVPKDIYHTVDMLIDILHSKELIKKPEEIKFAKTTLNSTQLQDALAKEIERLQTKTAAGKETTRQTEGEYIGLIARAIHLVESYDNEKAEQLLCDVLQHYDSNYNAWLWLARVTNNMSAIEFALKKAAYINPKRPELIEKIKKFNIARDNIKSNFVLRCPFCWAAVKEKDNDCHYCGASFFIDANFFDKNTKSKTEIMDKAIARYDEALQRDSTNLNNVYLHFYLAMAYLNRFYYQEALAQMNEAAKLAPDNNALIKQNSLLVSYMHSVGLIASMEISEKKSILSKRKVLVVEDSMVTRKVIARTLTANNYEVSEAKDADQALDYIAHNNPDLVLLDIILPGKDGYQILAEIRKRPQLVKTPVIMLTSRDSLFDKLKGKVSDANEYLTKPFQPDELLLVVKKYLK